MSSSKDHDDQHPSAQSSLEFGSRKTSMTTHLTSNTRDSTGETQINPSLASLDTIAASLPDDNALDFDKLISAGLDLSDNPDNARQWLLDLGHLKKGTDVSFRLRVKDNKIENGSAHSMFPLFTSWLPMWYNLAVQRRRADKLSRTADYKEQEDVHWLLKYIADYVCLGHDHFDGDELAALCVNLTQICQETGRQSVITDSITIIHNIITQTTFPEQALNPTLEVLCASTVNLSELSSELFDSVTLLLTGPLHEQVKKWLFECITTPTVQNNSSRLIEARGAIRQARLHLDTTNQSGTFTIDITSFLDCLNQASKCYIFRFCTEVLLACQSILESRQVQVLLDEDIRFFIATIENCTRTLLPMSGSSRSLESLKSSDRSQFIEHQRQNEKYLAERKLATKQMLSAFETTWHSLSDTQARFVSDFFMDHAKELNEGQAGAVITFLVKNGLLLPGADDWSQRGMKVFESFVKNTRLSAPERIEAATACIHAAVSVIPYANGDAIEFRDSVLATGKNMVDRVLNMMGKEYNTSVIRGIMLPLKSLTDCLDNQGKPQYAELIISKLLYFVKSEREGEDEATDEHVVLFTQAIRDIFLRGLHSSAHVAVQAYDALLEIASARCKSRRCRLAALRLLLRLRSDSEGFIYVQTSFDSEYIAAALCRTEETRDMYAKELAMQRRSSTSHFTGLVHTFSARQLWVYPKEASCMDDWDTRTSSLVTAPGAKGSNEHTMDLNMTSWLVTLIESLQSDNDWETYSFILVHLGAQLFNMKLFYQSLHGIVLLRQVLCEQVHNNSFKDPLPATGLKKSDAALCMFSMLTAMIPYASIKSEKIQRGFGDDLVKAFIAGIGNTWDGTHRGCIHALSLCSFQLPTSVARAYPTIVQTMGKHLSQSHLTIHILEFLAQVARLPEVHSSFNQNDITQIFGICLQYLEKAREAHLANLNVPLPSTNTPARYSGLSHRRPPYRAMILQDTALPQYASALAYHTIINWFLSLRLDIRAQYVSWIVPRLIYRNAKGEEAIEEQGEVLIDMMQRTAFSDLGETAPNPSFARDSDGTISTASWIVGLSIVTAETAGHTGLTQITKRQAAGTTHTSYQQLTTSLPSHHAPLHTQVRPAELSRFGTTDMLPAHIILQMVSTAAQTSPEDQPIYLPQEDWVTRALNVFDRIPTVDSHKIGVLYVGPGQFQEPEYLANTSTSPDFERFLYGLGYRVSLKPPLRYNPQGLQYPQDGEATMAWRDRVSEVVYHIPSMMPNNLEDDPRCNLKKSHVGNCHVVIVFNESGRQWHINNFQSAVTLVQVIITPVNRASTKEEAIVELTAAEATSQEVSSNATVDVGPTDFYQVVVVTKENYPNVSPAADPKVISRDALPAFVRMFSLNANLFSQARVAADSNDDEYPSTWRARLQSIKRLKDRVLKENAGPSRNQSVASTNTEKVTIGGKKARPHASDRIIRDESMIDENDGALAMRLDFGSWTHPSDKD